MQHNWIADEHAQGRLDKYLSVCLSSYSRSFLQGRIEAGAVWVNGKPAQAKQNIRPGDRVEVEVEPPKPLSAEAQDIPIDIVYEDADVVVVNKPSGLVVHPASGTPDGTLVNALLYHVKDLSGVGGVLRPGIVHRLDKDTSGLLVVAKNDRAHQSLAAQIQAKTACRIYEAIVCGVLGKDEGVVDAPIGRHRTDRKRMAVVSDGRPAVTHFRVLQRFRGFTHVQLQLETGRTHQIRVHMAHMGHSVAGDPVYSKQKCSFAPEGQLLHAARLSFDHPAAGERMTFTAPLPPSFEEALEKLKKRPL